MKGLMILFSALAVTACAHYPMDSAGTAGGDSTATPMTMAPQPCVGTTDIPDSLKGNFVEAVDPSLLNAALGEPGKGGLCEGQVYISTGLNKVTLYRAWNSTNPGSTYGNWWAFNKPAGKVAQYREDFEICYQWSPLDKLVTCELEAGTKVVVGTGQSAMCSQYLQYDVSASQQIYIENAESVMQNCTEFDAIMSWQ